MNDTLREYLSYPSFIIPLLKVKKIVKPYFICWGNKSQYFLHYKSPCKKSNNLIIYIHGGGWKTGSPKIFHFIGQRFALEGFDCIMPSYRKIPKFSYEEISGDIFQGYSAIGKYLSEKQFHYDKVIIVGTSAGAHLGAVLCYDTKSQAKYGISSQCFSGFVGLAGPFAFASPQTRELNKLLSQLFKSKTLERWRVGEPISMLQRGQQTRMLIVHSRHDGIVHYDQAEQFVERAKSLKIPAEIYEVSEAQNTHSAYSAGIFIKKQNESPTLEKILSWIAK